MNGWGARAAQTGVPRVSNSSGPHTRIDQNVAHAGDLSPRVLGAPRTAKIRLRTPHMTPAGPNRTEKICAIQVGAIEPPAGNGA